MALSGIHTHSGPGGYLQYVLYTITSLGFVRESFDTLVDGVVEVCAPRRGPLGGGPLMAVQRLCWCYRAHQCGFLALVMGAHSRAWLRRGAAFGEVTQSLIKGIPGHKKIH